VAEVGCLSVSSDLSLAVMKSQSSEVSSAAPAGPGTRGRPRKQKTPLVESSVRRGDPRPCTRQNKVGYRERALVDQPPRRKNVARKASTQKFCR
jgi:hypothetical protein